mmetsp:Transcript_24335/g.38327  ORF Transcript_24335/g.38327 Transcript_24335/m.38327 type:complete len:271 (+) Transcript_24335:897-1709(+)
MERRLVLRHSTPTVWNPTIWVSPSLSSILSNLPKSPSSAAHASRRPPSPPPPPPSRLCPRKILPLAPLRPSLPLRIIRAPSSRPKIRLRVLRVLNQVRALRSIRRLPTLFPTLQQSIRRFRQQRDPLKQPDHLYPQRLQLPLAIQPQVLRTIRFLSTPYRFILLPTVQPRALPTRPVGLQHSPYRPQHLLYPPSVQSRVLRFYYWIRAPLIRPLPLGQRFPHTFRIVVKGTSPNVSTTTSRHSEFEPHFSHVLRTLRGTSMRLKSLFLPV